MARRGVSSNRTSKLGEQQPLDLVPVMNLFITVIPMLLIITVSMHLALLALNIDPGGGSDGNGGNGGGGGEDVMKIEVIIQVDHFEIREGGEVTANIPAVQVSEGVYKFDFFALDKALSEAKERNEDIFVISVMPFDPVLYDTLLRTIDICKHNSFYEVSYELPTMYQIAL